MKLFKKWLLLVGLVLSSWSAYGQEKPQRFYIDFVDIDEARLRGYLYKVTDTTFQVVRKKEHLTEAGSQNSLIQTVPFKNVRRSGVRKPHRQWGGAVVGAVAGAALSYALFKGIDHSNKNTGKAMSDMSLTFVAGQLITLGGGGVGYWLGSKQQYVSYNRITDGEFGTEHQQKFRQYSFVKDEK